MPWISRPSRRWLRRWRYDHSEGVISFWIGAVIVVVVALAVIVLLVT